MVESAEGILGVVHVEELGKELVMWKLYVLPNHQGQGVGGLLVSAAKDRARSAGKDLLTEFDRTNKRVRGFYLREGFSQALAPWPGTDAIWLRWLLAMERSEA